MRSQNCQMRLLASTFRVLQRNWGIRDLRRSPCYQIWSYSHGNLRQLGPRDGALIPNADGADSCKLSSRMHQNLQSGKVRGTDGKSRFPYSFSKELLFEVTQSAPHT